MITIAPYESTARPGRDGFGWQLRAEWTKFRTVRGWVIAMLVAVLLTVGLGVLTARGSSCGQPPTRQDPTGACLPPATGPGGEWVTDEFYFAHRTLDGDGAITVRVTSLTGEMSASGGVPQGPVLGATRPDLEPWSKGGIIIKASLGQGSAYAAMMVTGAHGVRMQWNYTGDTPGLGGAVSSGSPRWLRLVRADDVITGYDSADGAHWAQVGRVALAGLPSAVQGGMFATSPNHTTVSTSLGHGSFTGGPTLATAAFDQVGVAGSWGPGTWTPTAVDATAAGNGPPAAIRAAESFAPVGDGGFTVTGSGDIAPADTSAGGSSPVGVLTTGMSIALIVVVVVAVMFITAEYRRGMIRLTFAASPLRGRVLAAKALVIGSVTFVAGLVAVAITVPIAERLLRANGNAIYPLSSLTLLRLEAGTAALLAAAAVLALALGAILRGGAGAVTAAIVVIVLPYILGTTIGLPSGVSGWLLRVTPAAAFAIQQIVPAYPQVSGNYTPGSGYYPLPPWGGFAVLCAWAAAALVAATVLLRRRDV